MEDWRTPAMLKALVAEVSMMASGKSVRSGVCTWGAKVKEAWISSAMTRTL